MPDTILVSWPLVDGGSFYEVTLTDPEGTQQEIRRTAAQSLDGQFNIVFDGLNPGVEYYLVLYIVDHLGSEVYQTAMTITTPIDMTPEPLLTTTIVTMKETDSATTQAKTAAPSSPGFTPTQGLATQPGPTDESPNAIMIVDRTSNTILVTWPLLEGGSSYELIFTQPDGNRISIKRSPSQSMNGNFYVVFNGLQPGSNYILQLTVEDEFKQEIYKASMTVTTISNMVTDSILTTQVVTIREGTTQGVSTQDVTSVPGVTTQSVTTPEVTPSAIPTTEALVTTMRISTPSGTYVFYGTALHRFKHIF